MSVKTWQLSLRSLLLLVTLIACFVGMYVGVWEAYPLVPAFITLIAATVCGMAWQWRSHRNGLSGAIIGGIVGANLAVAFHLVCGYTMLEFFEDEGLGFFGAIWVFCPYATVTGIIVGSFIWAVAYPTSSFIMLLLRKDQAT